MVPNKPVSPTNNVGTAARARWNERGQIALMATRKADGGVGYRHTIGEILHDWYH
jgi:hypothetical protein